MNFEFYAKTNYLRALNLIRLPVLTSRLRNCFLCFIRRFWNQVFTCVSLRPRAAANSTRSGVDKYLDREIEFLERKNCKLDGRFIFFR